MLDLILAVNTVVYLSSPEPQSVLQLFLNISPPLRMGSLAPSDIEDSDTYKHRERDRERGIERESEKDRERAIERESEKDRERGIERESEKEKARERDKKRE